VTAASERVGPGLAAFNTADAGEVRDRLLTLTASPRWAEELVSDRPYADLDAVLVHSDEILRAIDVTELDAALAGHPRIGERVDAAHFDDESAARSAREQAGANTADSGQKRELAEVNAAYENRFGRIYLVAAAGLSAAELLAKAQARLGHEPQAELDVVRAELATITRSRLTDWLT
jgi:2-oxo-4-hydroxy-4-carboxy-5-ureidoimidazoline decarboxylase